MTDQNMPETASKNTGMIVGIIAVLIIVVAAILIYASMRPSANNEASLTNESNEVFDETANDENEAANIEVETNQGNVNVSVPPMTNEAENESVKTFKVSGNNFAFDLKEMRVKEGDKVEIVFTNQSGMHDLLIDEFNVNTELVPAGSSKTVSFTASKKGSFQYYCSVGQHRANGMWGTLIVE